VFCSACNFDLRGLPTSTCPECGRAFCATNAATFLERPRSTFARLLPRILLVAGVVFVLGVAGVGYLLYSGARATMRAEERLQATRVVGDLIAAYVEKSPTHSWPTSWAELEKLPHEGCMFAWPGQAAEYKAIVNIDFTMTTAQVLKQTPATCTAVTVTPGPSFSGFPALELEPMFDRLHNAADKLPTQPRSP